MSSEFMNGDIGLKDMKIVLVEDDEWIRDSMSLFFRARGGRLRAVETGEEGLEAVNEESVDLIIVDHRLPGMDGLEFLERIKCTHPDTPKILITAYGNEELFARAARLGAGECIEKPLTAETLIRAIVSCKPGGWK